MKGGPKEQVTTTKLDPGAQKFRDQAYQKANDVANQGYTGYAGERVAGADPYSTGAAGNMSGMGGNFMALGNRANGMQFGGNLQPYDQAGAVGARALGGDQGAIASMMNPYQKNVIDAMGTEYDRMRDKATMGANSEATAGGAFGGSRNALMVGERQGAIDRAQGSDIANLLHGGYTDVMNQANQAANVGLNAGNQRLTGQGLQLDANGQAINAGNSAMDAYGRQFGMGDTFRGYRQDANNSNQDMFNQQRDWGLRGTNIMNAAMGAPTGQTTSQPLYKNKFNSVLGGAATGFGVGGPIGAAIGGAGGLLFG